MADLRELLERLKAEFVPTVVSAGKSLSANALPFLKSLGERASQRWAESTQAEKLKVGAIVSALVVVLASSIYLYRSSSYYARRKLTELRYDLSATALMNACLQMDMNALEFFKQAKWPMDSKLESGLTPLMTAADQGQITCLQELVKRGADPNVQNEHGESAIIFAIRSRSLETVQAILAAKPQLNYLTADKASSPLMAAMTKPHHQLIQALLDAGANPNLPHLGNRTPLFAAATIEDTSTLELLLAKKADPNSTDLSGTTPLLNAIRSRRRANVQALLKAGAKPNPQDERTLSSLHGAIDEGQIEILRDLLTQGADPNVRHPAGLTPLIRAVALADEEMVTTLLDKGADINARIKLSGIDELRPETFEEFAALDMTYFVANEPTERIEKLLKSRNARAVVSRTERVGMKDLETLRLIENIHRSAQFIRGRILETKNDDGLLIVHQLLHRYSLEYNQINLVNVSGSPAVFISTDSRYPDNAMFTALAFKWGNAHTSSGMVPVYVESNRTGRLRKQYQALFSNAYNHFLLEWSDRIPAAFSLAGKLKASHATALGLDEVTLLSAIYFSPYDLGKALQVQSAARTASLCQIHKSGVTSAQWNTELPRIIDFIAKTEPNLLLKNAADKTVEKIKSEILQSSCVTQPSSKSGEVSSLSFAQCMCGSSPTTQVASPPPETLARLKQMVVEYRTQEQADAIRSPAAN